MTARILLFVLLCPHENRKNAAHSFVIASPCVAIRGPNSGFGAVHLDRHARARDDVGVIFSGSHEDRVSQKEHAT